MAWLVAFSEKLLDSTPSAEIPAALKTLAERVMNNSLTLENSHEDWKQAVESWLNAPGAATGA
jgi:hypothetical protein